MPAQCVYEEKENLMTDHLSMYLTRTESFIT
jgi:hypothetical protein